MTALKLPPAQLSRTVSRLLPMLKVGNYSFTDQQLVLGQLKGNHFTM